MNLAYLTDVEGQWSKLATFAAKNPLVTLTASDTIDVAPGAVFVFGGDAVDRGPEALRLVRALLDAKRRQPEQVILIAGNRDINKLRLRRELTGQPPRRTPEELRGAPRGELLRWILANTMAAPRAFEHRRAELGGAPDDDVAQSFVDDVARDGVMTEYLARCQLVHRDGATLFVHGAVTRESLFVTPGSPPAADLEAWIARLNGWYAARVVDFRDGALTAEGEPAWLPLNAYQAPLPGTRMNQASVVYGRLADAHNNPHLPPEDVIRALAHEGINRLVVGHTPSGDSPSVLRAGGFELVVADNSYGRVEEGSKVLVRGDHVDIVARVELDDGSRPEVASSLDIGDDDTPIGKRDAATGHLVKGRLPGGEYLLYKGLPGYRVEQLGVPAHEIHGRRLHAPHREPPA